MTALPSIDFTKTDLAYWKRVVAAAPGLTLEPRLTKYIPHAPTPKQAAFLLLNQLEAMYGGSARGGKTDAVLMAALQYVDIPGYNALILRRTFAELSLPDAVMDRSLKWLSGTGAHWSAELKRWTFPSGATLTFGYLQTMGDIYRYQGPQFQFIAFDELTQFLEGQYTYLFSRLTSPAGWPYPIRMRSTTNPGGIGHEWVKQRFIVEGLSKGRIFIPASLYDNPHVDADQYVKSLNELDPVTRRQLLEGDWDASYAGGLFRRAWFTDHILDTAPRLSDLQLVRFWDLASTEPNPANPDPDWTVGTLVGRGKRDGHIYILDQRAARLTPKKIEALVQDTAAEDGKAVPIRMEEEGGSSGKAQIAHYGAMVLPGYDFKGVKHGADKLTRAKPFSAHAERGNVSLVRGPWIGDFLNEAELFPYGAHDDRIDSAVGGFEELTTKKPSVARVAVRGLYR